MTVVQALVRRPTGIDPADWQRMSWHARLRAHNRAVARPIDRWSNLAYHSTADDYVDQVEELIAAGWSTMTDIAREMERSPKTINQRLRTAGRRDLIDQLKATQ